MHLPVGHVNHLKQQIRNHCENQLLPTEMMHSRTWDRASAEVRSNGTVICGQIWSSSECQLVGVEVLGSQLLAGLVAFRGKPGIEEVQGSMQRSQSGGQHCRAPVDQLV